MDALYRLFASDFRIQHAIRGRIRIKIDKVKGNPSLAKELEQRLTASSIVRRATANPLTGSLLILYDPRFLAWFKSPELCGALLQESAAELAGRGRTPRAALDLRSRPGPRAVVTNLLGRQ